MTENNLEKAKIIQIVGFKLNNEEYALEIENVQEIIKKVKTTRVPRSRKYVSGVINLRGIIVLPTSFSFFSNFCSSLLCKSNFRSLFVLWL